MLEGMDTSLSVGLYSLLLDVIIVNLLRDTSKQIAVGGMLALVCLLVHCSLELISLGPIEGWRGEEERVEEGR